MEPIFLPTLVKQAAPWIFILVLLWCCVCLGYGHRAGKINLWDLITTSKRLVDGAESRSFTDPKKLAYVGAFVVMTVGYAYLCLLDRLSEWYAVAYVGAFVLGKWLGDREQRLSQKGT